MSLYIVRTPVHTPSRHLILSLWLPGVHEAWFIPWIVSFTWSGHWFWLQIFPLTWLHTLLLTTDFCIWNVAHGGCGRSKGDAYVFYAPDSTSIISCGPFSYLYMYLFHDLWDDCSLLKSGTVALCCCVGVSHLVPLTTSKAILMNLF
jgi:hypothetical protein